MSSPMPSRLLTIAVVSLLFAVGCGSSINTSNVAQLRIMNASPQQQSLNLLVDNATAQTAIVSEAASAYVPEPAGNHTLQIEAFGTATALVTQGVTLNRGTYYTVLAVEPAFASTSLTMTLLTDDNSAPSSGNIKLRILNASPDFGHLDAYVTAPGAGLTGATPSVSNLAFQAASSYLSLPAGNYEVYFTISGRQVISVDSGQLSFSAGQIRTLVLADNFGTGFTADLLADLN